ncbi:hypothetical protein CMU02_14700 [Elizabethkingia anophelis]|uniref:hypothetical protein n=1 Tax=Elizabethkingia anophelis TaxID=1117645 RepID=UPI002935CB36|nr:hypothetical protein [Elizabethkingia anophelis]MDV3472627.1 hypothetical protein [Elizabethkingia anophelis]MDV3906043.1 hypothetical protein [Elizabethkingia anophelis]
MKTLHLSYKDDISSIKEFSEAEYQEIDEILKRFVLNAKMKWAFQVIERNFYTLFKAADIEFENLSKEDLLWENLELASLEINRHILNYLASQNAFLDHSFKFLSKKFGSNSDESQRFTKMTNDLFADHFSYRFLYKLRNFTVHLGFSLCAIEIEYTHKQITFIPKFIYEDLMEDPAFWGAKVRPDLLAIGDDFPAFNLLRESLDHFRQLSDFLMTEFVEDEEKAFVKRFYELTEIDSALIDKYCFLVVEDDLTKITQIPVHYLKI